MAPRAAKKSRVTISDGEDSDPLNIDLGSAKSASKTEDEEDDEEEELQVQVDAGTALLTPPRTGMKKRKKKNTGE